MNVLVTGATGFIGRAVTKQLSGRYNVFAITRDSRQLASVDSLVWLIGDLCDERFLAEVFTRYAFDAVIHLAWDGIPDLSMPPSVGNLVTGVGLVRHVVEGGSCKRLVISGSCLEYGRSYGACREDVRCNPDSYFTWSKDALHEFSKLACGQYGVELFWLRIFYAYGAGQRTGSIVPTIVNALTMGGSPNIRSPHNANDFIHVDDVALGISSALRAESVPGIYNIGSGRATSIATICEMIKRSLAAPSSVTEAMVEAPNLGTVNFWADISKAREGLGWEPSIPLRDGIRGMVRGFHDIN